MNVVLDQTLLYVAAAGIALVAAALIWRNSIMKSNNLSLIERKDDEIARLNEQLAAMGQKLTAAEVQREADAKHADEKLQTFKQMQADMQIKFKQLADEALKVQGENLSKANMEKLDAALTPLKEHMGHFEKSLKQANEQTIEERGFLKSELKRLTERSEQISQEAVALTNALKGDSQRQGAWGEMVLESILERSGLRKGEEYEVQTSRTDSEGKRLRPDVVVKLPEQKTLVIDSKVSLLAYERGVNAPNEQEAETQRKNLVRSLRAHIDGLSDKGYQLYEAQSVDYVIMFVPIEGALAEALRHDGKLTQYALEKNITLASPTVLMMALRTIANIWSVERRNKNAEEIAKRAGLLYDKVAGFVQNLEKLGAQLGSAQKSYETALGQLATGRGNVLSQVEALKTLGAKTSKKIEANSGFDDEPIPLEDNTVNPLSTE